MNINKFYKKKINSQVGKCIGYYCVSAPNDDNKPGQSLTSYIQQMCNAANNYISANGSQTNAKAIARKKYEAGDRGSFNADYSALGPVLAPGANREDGSDQDFPRDDQSGSGDGSSPSSRRNHNLNDDNRSNSNTQPPKKKSKKSFKPTAVPATDDRTAGSRRSASPSSATANPEKDRTKNPTSAMLLSSEMKKLPYDIYYQILDDHGANLRLVLCAVPLSGPNIAARQAKLEKTDLIKMLLNYFKHKVGKTTPAHLTRITHDCDRIAGAFFAYPVPKNKNDLLLGKLKKMNLKSREEFYPDKTVSTKVKIKVPKPSRTRQKSPENGQK